MVVSGTDNTSSNLITKVGFSTMILRKTMAQVYVRSYWSFIEHTNTNWVSESSLWVKPIMQVAFTPRLGGSCRMPQQGMEQVSEVNE